MDSPLFLPTQYSKTQAQKQESCIFLPHKTTWISTISVEEIWRTGTLNMECSDVSSCFQTHIPVVFLLYEEGEMKYTVAR